MQNIEKIRKILPPETHYFWMAELKSGDIIFQFNEDGTENLFKAVLEEEQKGNLNSIAWMPANKNKPFISCKLEEDKRAILFRRHKKTIGRGFLKHEVFYAIGWQKTVNGKNVKSIIFIDKEGNIKIGEYPDMV